MKAKDLAEKLLQYPDFDVEFSFMEPDDSHYGMRLRSFNDIDITDIGHSDKIIVLGERNNMNYYTQTIPAFPCGETERKRNAVDTSF